MRVTVLYFARARELAGVGQEDVELPPGSTGASLLTALAGRIAAARRAPSPDAAARALAGCVLAVNNAYVDVTQPLVDGDAVAVIPPVSGG